MPLESIFCGLEAMKVEATTAPAAPLRLDAAEVTDSKADAQMVLQTTDVRVVLQACDARVALASVGKLPEDARSLEVESDRQRRLDRAGRHRQLDSDLDSVLDFDFGLNSILDFDRDLDSARFHEGELALRKAPSTRETVLWTMEVLAVVSTTLDTTTTASSAAARSGYPSPSSDDW